MSKMLEGKSVNESTPIIVSSRLSSCMRRSRKPILMELH
jgi:hypothetical protein